MCEGKLLCFVRVRERAKCEKVITALHKFHRTLRKTNYFKKFFMNVNVHRATLGFVSW